MTFTYLWEVKFIRPGKKFYYNEKAFIKERRNLKIGSKHFIYKFPDIGYGNPMDGISITNAPGYVFIMFQNINVGMKGNKFYIIEIDKIEEDINKGVKSMDEAKAKKLACDIGKLK